MTETLLATKFYIPPARPKIVRRGRLVGKLNDGLHRKLTLICAPAGFGKTTLATEWIDSLRPDIKKETQSKPKIAWLSLDQSDNDPVRFLSYLITALNQIEGLDVEFRKRALAILQTPQPPPIETILTSLINKLSASNVRVIVVLDDYHLIETQSIHDALAFLLEHIPPHLHLVLLTREDPEFPLGRLRAKDQLTELRAADLRFTTSETVDFLNRVMELNLTAEDIDALETRTEGWIVGLQLAAISMQSSDDATTFIKSFTGSHRFVLDYLLEEVLERQTGRIKEFLIQTSVLHRLTGSLCEALTGQKDGQKTLEELERANLFIMPLDNESRWYRCHHLFAELLRQRLIFNNNQMINDLHAKAANWYKKNGNISEAVHHALAGEDIKTASELIEAGAPAALKNSDFKFVLDSVDRLPESALQKYPWLFIYHAWALLLTGQVNEASPRLQNTDWLLELFSESDEINQREMLGNLAGLKMIQGGWQKDYKKITEYSNQVREYLPENNWIRGYCAMMTGYVFWGSGHLDAAINAFAEAASVGETAGHKMAAVSAACNHAYSLELAGRLHQAVNLFQSTFKLTEQDGRVLPVAGYIHKEIARVLYELNELDRAEQHLEEGIKRCQRMIDGRAEKISHNLLAIVQLAKGDINNFHISIRNAEKAVLNSNVAFDLRGGEFPQVRLWLKETKINELERWLKENPIKIEEVSHFKIKLTYTIHARVLIALYREHLDDTYIGIALELLDELLAIAENNGWESKGIEILALQALAYQEIGNSELALTKLERALTLAKLEGFIRTFVDEGLPMAKLLYDTLSRGIAPGYVRRLLAAFPIPEPEKTINPQTQISEFDWIDSLSERELEVLQLIAEGLTNQEIASRLFLSPNTVKVHAHNIFSKLGVGNRTQAVARAREIGILPST